MGRKGKVSEKKKNNIEKFVLRIFGKYVKEYKGYYSKSGKMECFYSLEKRLDRIYGLIKKNKSAGLKDLIYCLNLRSEDSE